MQLDSKFFKVYFGVPVFLFVLFIVLKLSKVIHWSWWLVTLPVWGSIALAVIAFVVYFWLRIRAQRGNG
jgi:hypothetical protein